MKRDSDEQLTRLAAAAAGTRHELRAIVARIDRALAAGGDYVKVLREVRRSAACAAGQLGAAVRRAEVPSGAASSERAGDSRAEASVSSQNGHSGSVGTSYGVRPPAPGGRYLPKRPRRFVGVV